MANIPAAVPLQVNINVPQGANAVSANQIPDDMAVIMETERLKAIEIVRKLGGIDVVSNEVMADAITRQHMIVAKHSGMGAAPAWANALVAQMEGLTVQMNQMEDTFNARMGQLEGTLNARIGQIEGVLNDIKHDCSLEPGLPPVEKQ